MRGRGGQGRAAGAGATIHVEGRGGGAGALTWEAISTYTVPGSDSPPTELAKDPPRRCTVADALAIAS